MKKSIKLLYGFIVLFACILIVSCSNEDVMPSSSTSHFEDLTFIVNIDKDVTSTRAASYKKDWTVGDKIIAAIDANDSNICILQYQGNGDWSVTKYNDQTSFAKEEGTLGAVHADSLNIDSNSITTYGDILYTKEGKYIKHDNVVEINLSMNQRPVSRIAIVGMDSTFWMDGLKLYSKLQSVSSMQWNEEQNSSTKPYVEIYGDTCVFYGILDSDDEGNTSINLINSEGSTYKRTYNGKSVKSGDYIIINGPESNESNLWTSNIPVKGISANENEISLLLETTGNAKEWYTLSPKQPSNLNVSYVSSNSDVLEISSDGTYKAKAKGTSEVTITTEDGSFSCKISVTVSDLVDLVTFKVTGTSIIMNGYGIYYGRTFTIKNDSDFGIDVTELDGTVSGGSIHIDAHSSKDITNYYRINGYMKDITLKFTCNGKEYEKTAQFDI